MLQPAATHSDIGAFNKRTAVFHDILVTPTLRGAGRPLPLRGGVQFPAESPAWVHHCRAGAVHGLPESVVNQVGPVESLSGTFVYGGPLWWHFGHQVGEFMHRLWVLGEPGLEDATVVFTETRGARRPGFINALLDIFKIKNVLFVEAPVRLQHLVVGEPGKMLGSKAAPEYIEFLERRFSWLRKINKKTPAKLAVMRDHLPKGRCIGEAWITKKLESLGFVSFRPELHSIDVQMLHYLNAEEIIFSEGSAIHLVDIMPKLTARVAVLGRRENSTLAEDTLTGKCSELYVYRNCILLGHPFRAERKMGMGITAIDPNGFLDFLAENDFIPVASHDRFFQNAGQVAADLMEYMEVQAKDTGAAIAGNRGRLFQEAIALLCGKLGEIAVAPNRGGDVATEVSGSYPEE